MTLSPGDNKTAPSTFNCLQPASSKLAFTNSCIYGGNGSWGAFRYPFHSHVTAAARKRSVSFCQKCRWQVTDKHTCTLRISLSNDTVNWCTAVWHTQNVRRDGSSFALHQPCDDQKSAYVHCFSVYSKRAIKGYSHLFRIVSRFGLAVRR